MSFSYTNLKSGSNFTLPNGRVTLPFTIEAAITSLPVFCANASIASLLDPLVEYLLDGSYQLIIRACPGTQQEGGSNIILASQTFEDQISVPAGSFLTMVGGIGFVQDGGVGAFNVLSSNFRTEWYDAGAQAPLGGGYIHANCNTGNFTQLPQTGTGMLTTVGGNKNLFILPSPLSITSPGQLNVRITNLESSTQMIDMAFYFAAPTGGYTGVKGAKIGNAVTR